VIESLSVYDVLALESIAIVLEIATVQKKTKTLRFQSRWILVGDAERLVLISVRGTRLSCDWLAVVYA
jgi:hypothetical protein